VKSTKDFKAAAAIIETSLALDSLLFCYVDKEAPSGV
jgi:hypothetical protein